MTMLRPAQAWIDIGGTFTDCFVRDADGDVVYGKTLSSGLVKGVCARGSTTTKIVDPRRSDEPDDFWRGAMLRLTAANIAELWSRRVISQSGGMLELDAPLPHAPAIGSGYDLSADCEPPTLAVRQLLRIPLTQPLPPLDVRLGTTRGTNALLTRSGAPVALLTTRGFGDLLEIGEQDRPELFALDIRKAAPLASCSIEIDERIAADGQVIQAPDDEQVIQQLAALRRQGVQSLAICLLHGFRFPQHERRIADLARQHGWRDISLSHEVAGLIKLVARAQTTVLDAYLRPVLRTALHQLERELGPRVRVMTSGGDLVSVDQLRGPDTVLSGPAGGAIALQAFARAHRLPAVIGLDMGGTSTDVCCVQQQAVPRRYAVRKAGVQILAPIIDIETVAAGGGSICRIIEGRLHVGPQSAGSFPGPACYGQGGPLTVTDLNVVLGRVDPTRFPFPLDRAAAVQQLQQIGVDFTAAGGPAQTIERLAEGLWQIAVHQMAEAVRTATTARGLDPRPMTLVGFGGAAGQHACQVAEILQIEQIFDPAEASLLSALGMGLARIGRSAAMPVYQGLPRDRTAPAFTARLDQQLQSFAASVAANLVRQEDLSASDIQTTCSIELRYQGTEAALELPWIVDPQRLAEGFHAAHRDRFGYAMADRDIEVVALRVHVTGPSAWSRSTPDAGDGGPPPPTQSAFAANASDTQPIYFRGDWLTADAFDREQLSTGAHVTGPAVVHGRYHVTVIDPGWFADIDSAGGLWLRREPVRPIAMGMQRDRETHRAANPRTDEDTDDPVLLEVLAQRWQAIAEQMGSVLEQTAISVNVRERRDFSCAVFDAGGGLVASAPHVPVHLGAMGHTVRALASAFPAVQPGDCLLTNDPYAGGSHLPDVTVAIPVFAPATSGRGLADRDATSAVPPAFWVAARAHHAEIGGITPGSMPPTARTLAEEGVVLPPIGLMYQGRSAWDEVEQRLRSGPWPSRNPAENLADLRAQVAACRQGAAALEALARQHSAGTLLRYMDRLQSVADRAVQRLIAQLGMEPQSWNDQLDDGTPLRATLQRFGDRLRIDFTGTGPVHPGNFNANPSIVTAAVLYVLRCLIDVPLPLCEGALRSIDLEIPPGLLRPPAELPPELRAAVAAGNVETSQRVVDCLLGALGVAAASQGTMNNLLLGDPGFGYYETIGGGSGATAHRRGAGGVQTHMTNTRITDPEVLETRFPIRLLRFSLRPGSGGRGGHRGGHGLVRHFQFMRPLTVSLLTQRRTTQPYGRFGGGSGMSGRNIRHHADGRAEVLGSVVSYDAAAGEALTIETPGGGGWGVAVEMP